VRFQAGWRARDELLGHPLGGYGHQHSLGATSWIDGGRVRAGLRLSWLVRQPWNLLDHRGKWVVVNFWATWCTPCLAEIPDLAQFDAARADVDVIGLAYEEIEHADMVAFLAKRPIPYPIAVLDVYAPPPDFETPRGLPMTYLIAPDGKVAKTFLGPVTSAELAKLIDGGAGEGKAAGAP